MGGFKTEQRQLSHRGRMFHFVSYEGQNANPARKLQAVPATWYLLSSSNRWPAIPHQAGQPDAELDGLLADWLEAHVFAPAATA